MVKTEPLFLSDLGVSHRDQLTMLNYLRSRPGFKCNIVKSGRRKRDKIIVDEKLKNTVVNALKTRTRAYEQVYSGSGTHKAVTAVLNHFGMKISDITITEPNVCRSVEVRESKRRERMPSGAVLVIDLITNSRDRASFYSAVKRANIQLPVVNELSKRPVCYMTKELWNSQYKQLILNSLELLTGGQQSALRLLYSACQKQFNQKETM